MLPQLAHRNLAGPVGRGGAQWLALNFRGDFAGARQQRVEAHGRSRGECPTCFEEGELLHFYCGAGCARCDSCWG